LAALRRRRILVSLTVGVFMSRLANLATGVAAVTLLACASPVFAQQPASGAAGKIPSAASRASDISAQDRPRTRLRVTPLRRAPLDRRAYRQCEDWLATEHRPSGTVIVPKMRCWWVRG
jgi:hypothetical protein